MTRINCIPVTELTDNQAMKLNRERIAERLKK